MSTVAIKGYVPPQDGDYGPGDWVDITPSQGIIEITTERRIDAVDSATISLSKKAEYDEFRRQRSIQILLDNTLIWEGMIFNTEIAVNSPFMNVNTVDILCVGYEKFLMRQEITKEWTNATLDSIFTDLYNELNADMPFPTVRQFYYDKAYIEKYNDAYEKKVTESVDSDDIYSTIHYFTNILSYVDVENAAEYTFYLDYMRDSELICLMPVQLNSGDPVSEFFTDESKIYAGTSTYKRNYNKIINYCHVIGDEIETKHYHDTKLASDVTVSSDSFYIAAAANPSKTSFLAIEIENNNTGQVYGSFLVTGFDGADPANSIHEWIPFKAPHGKTTTIYTSKRFAALAGPIAFRIQNMTGATVNVYQTTNGIAGSSISEYGLSQQTIRKIDFVTQEQVDEYAHQVVQLYQNPVNEMKFRLLDYNTDDYLNKTIWMPDPIYARGTRYLVTKQEYAIPEDGDIEMWLSGIHTNYAWE